MDDQERQSKKGLIREKATIEVSLYLYPSHDDKLDELRMAYKRQTGKKITTNSLIRLLIERATLELLLQS